MEVAFVEVAEEYFEGVVATAAAAADIAVAAYTKVALIAEVVGALFGGFQYIGAVGMFDCMFAVHMDHEVVLLG